MQYWGITDPGCVRAQNQDAYQIEQLDRGGLLCVVCDGMGGAKSGNIASTLAVDVFVEEVRRTWTPGIPLDKLEQMLRGAVKLANFTVFDQAMQFEAFSGMGTTLVAVLIKGKEATVVNVGDSRAYFIDRVGIHQVTVDHSVVQLMVNRGELTPEQAKTYPGKSLITRAIGTESMVPCDMFHKKVSKGDYFLLCSDGLTNYANSEALAKLVKKAVRDQNTKHLIDYANNRGGSDNITAVLLYRA